METIQQQLNILAMQNQIHRQKLMQFIQDLKGKIFQVCWIKKDGTHRCANVRLGVRKHLKGTGKSPAKNTNGYITVYLMWSMDGDTFKAESGYRSLNLETITSIQADNIFYGIYPSPINKSVDLSVTTIEQPDNILALSA